MSNSLVALFFAAGVGGWVYFQANRRMSGNAKAVWGVTILVAAIAYFVMYTTFSMFLPS